MTSDAKHTDENNKLWAEIYGLRQETQELRREVQELKTRQQIVSEIFEERQQQRQAGH